MFDLEGKKTEEEIDILSYLFLLLNHLWLVLAFTGLFGALAFVISLTKEPLYRSSALLKVVRQSSDLNPYSNMNPWGYLSPEFLNTETMILKNQSVAAEIIKIKGVDFFSHIFEQKGNNLFSLIKGDSSEKKELPSEEAIKAKKNTIIGYLVSRFSVETVKNTHLLKISFVSTDPDFCKEVVSAWIQAYINYGLEVDFEKNTQAFVFLENQELAIQEKIDKVGSEMAAFSKETEIFTLGSKGSNVEDMVLTQVNAVLVKSETKLIEAKSQLQKLLQTPPSELKEVELNPLIKTLTERLLDMKSNYQKDLNIYQPELEKMKTAKSQIDALTLSLKQEREKYYTQLLNSARATIRETENEVQQLTSRLEDQKRKSSEQNLVSRTQFDTLQSELVLLRQQQAVIGQRKQEVNMALSLNQISRSNKTVIQKPGANRNAFSPNKQRETLVGLILGFLFSIGIIFVIEISDRTIHSIEELESTTKLTLLAVIPANQGLENEKSKKWKGVVKGSLAEKGKSILKRKDGRIEGATPRKRMNVALTSFNAPTSMVAESYRQLRTSIQLSNTDESTVFVLTSSVSGEGKTVSAINLATSFAQLEKKVIIIDCDLRRPQINKVFDLKREPGMVNYIVGQKNLNEIIYRTKVPNLDLITSGPIPPNPAELLASNRLQLGIAELKERYDIVFIDSAPMLAVADASVLANLGDKMIFVCKANSTHKDAVRAAVALCEKNKIKPLGTIFNDFDYSRGKLRYGYGYNYKYRAKGYQYSTYKYRSHNNT